MGDEAIDPTGEGFDDEINDGRMLVAERLSPSEASMVLKELADAGIEAQLLALPDERETGPFDVLVLDEHATAAYEAIQDIEILETEDNWFSARPQWQQAAFVLVGTMAVLIPLLFALAAILSNA